MDLGVEKAQDANVTFPFTNGSFDQMVFFHKRFDFEKLAGC